MMRVYLSQAFDWNGNAIPIVDSIFLQAGVFTTFGYRQLASSRFQVHLDRLNEHASAIGMKINSGVIIDFLSNWWTELSPMGPEWQIRIAAMEQGFQCDAKPFTPRPRELLGRIWNHQRKLPELKTLDYQALADRQREDGPDVESLLCNDKGVITEGVRTNLVYGINGRVFVPKSDCLFGLGIQRVLPLLNRHCTPCNESLLLSHLPKVEEILAINDLQGVCWLSEISEVGWKARSTRLIEILRAELPQNLRWW